MVGSVDNRPAASCSAGGASLERPDDEDDEQDDDQEPDEPKPCSGDGEFH